MSNSRTATTVLCLEGREACRSILANEQHLELFAIAAPTTLLITVIRLAHYL
jgi:hypothetical protein